ncbi:unnamed protein product [Pleuronectes platessa]|uniref:Uncharacterized protein n=1 Tax=Pleuronectes platessa TaxID=8262 RepID=A0A9N7VJP2_PLEPL|nr:unnamed protein product [Pleuronectes platessa]
MWMQQGGSTPALPSVLGSGLAGCVRPDLHSDSSLCPFRGRLQEQTFAYCMHEVLVGFHLPEGALRGHIMHGRQLSLPPVCKHELVHAERRVGQKKEHEKMGGDGNHLGFSLKSMLPDYRHYFLPRAE